MAGTDDYVRQLEEKVLALQAQVEILLRALQQVGGEADAGAVLFSQQRRADAELLLLGGDHLLEVDHRLLEVLQLDLGARQVALAGVDLRVDLSDQVLGASQLDLDRDLVGHALAH